MAMQNNCRYIKITKNQEGYALIKRISQSEMDILSSIVNGDSIEFCFLGEIKEEEILREINPETYIEEREVKFFYLTPSEKSKEIISKLILEGKILSFMYGKQGGYVITEGENYKSVINEV